MFDSYHCDYDVRERPMSVAMKKATASVHASNGGRRFPPEAYKYDDDVTPEAVDVMRKKAAKAMADSDEWEVVDGFGLAEPA